MRKSNLSFIIFLGILIAVGMPYEEARAQSTSTDKELAEVALRARKRLYPGGRDESDLQVLSRVPEPLLKVNRNSVEDQVLENMSSSEESSGED